MKARGRSIRNSHRRFAVTIVGILAVVTALMSGGPAGARGLSLNSNKLHSYDFDAPTSAAVVGANLFVTNGANNSVTEVKSSDGSFVATISGKRFGFDAPRPSSPSAVTSLWRTARTTP